MKLTSILLIFSTLVPGAVLALPGGTSPNDAHAPRAAAARTCYLHNEALDQNVGCDYDPFNGVRRKRVTGGDRPVVTCVAKGRSVSWPFSSGTSTSDKWDYVDAWGCWVWSGFTQDGCENGMKTCGT